MSWYSSIASYQALRILSYFGMSLSYKVTAVMLMESTLQATILFLSSSPNSPFLKHSSHSPSLQSGQIQPLSSLPLDAPVPDRTWLTFNAGQIWDASLVGYREMSKALEMERNTTSEAGHDGRKGRRLGGIWQEGPQAVKEYVLAVREGLRKGQRPALVEKVYQSKKVLSRLVSRGKGQWERMRKGGTCQHFMWIGGTRELDLCLISG